MKPIYSALLGLAAALPLLRGAESVHLTSTSVTYLDPIPPIDALSWINTAQFRVFSFSPYNAFTPTSLRSFTNSGSLYGDPGFRFMDYEVTQPIPKELPMVSFGNSGSILSSYRLSVLGNNIYSPGRLMCNEQGFIVLTATNSGSRVNLQNGGLQAGLLEYYVRGTDIILEAPSYGLNGNGGYTNDFGVTDMYWGTGLNNRITGTATNGPGAAGPIRLDTLSFFLSIPESESHEIGRLTLVGLRTNTTFMPNCPGPFKAYVQSSDIDPSNHVQQVVYVATNLTYTNFTTDVRFVVSNDFQRGWTSIVQFAWSDTNIVDGKPVTTYLYLIDSSMSAGAAGVYGNMVTGTRRPAAYQLTHGVPWEWFFGSPTFDVNDFLPPDFFFPRFFYPFPLPPGGTFLQSVTNAGNVGYASYEAWLGVTNFAPRLNPLIVDSTNLHGKVEIFASSLNATNARIRAENYAGVQTGDLQNNALPKIDAPFVNLDLGASGRTLLISNALPEKVIRWFGALAVYTVTYTNAVAIRVPAPTATDPNAVGTNYDTTSYQVTIVDNNCLQPPDVTLDRFKVRANQLVVEDVLNINSSALLDVASVSIGREGVLRFPVNSSWAPSNVPSLKTLLNNGRIEVPRDATFAGASGSALTSFINHGFIGGSSINIRTGYFENTDPSAPLPGVSPSAVISCTNGQFNVVASTALMTNGVLTNGGGSIQFVVNSLQIARTAIGAGTVGGEFGLPTPGTLVISPTSFLGDGSYYQDFTWHLAGNEWNVTGGFVVDRLPPAGDLLGTTIRSTIMPASPNTHIWPGRDLGASGAGYTNNLALGKLVLDSQGFNTIAFAGPSASGRYALYVDYLELLNDATNVLSSDPSVQPFDIAPNFTIYFANASIPPPKLDGLVNGHLVWLHDFNGSYDFAGPYSGTNFVYVTDTAAGPVTNHYVFNVALVSDPDIDSNYNGIVNPNDPHPIFTPSDIDLVVSLVSAGKPAVQNAQLTWNALAYATNIIEYSSQAGNNATWQLLKAFKQGPVNQRVSYVDPLPVVGVPTRIYRIREDAQWPAE